MKEVIIGFVLMFGLIGASVAYLGMGENRHIGFTNICGDRGVFCYGK